MRKQLMNSSGTLITLLNKQACIYVSVILLAQADWKYNIVCIILLFLLISTFIEIHLMNMDLLLDAS